MPARQYSQLPSVWCSQAMPTRAPGLNREAPSPHFSTTPTIWCPGITGDLRGASSPSTTCRSVRHTPHIFTRTSTSPRPGAGVGTSVNCSGFVSTAAGAWSKQAFIARLPPPILLPKFVRRDVPGTNM
jgi:hypothetical protein